MSENLGPEFDYTPYQEGVLHGPYLIEDEAEFLAKSPRKSRMTGILSMEDEVREMAIQNHAALLAALSAYEAGLITKDAYQHLRVAATLKHGEYRRVSGQDPRVVVIGQLS